MSVVKSVCCHAISVSRLPPTQRSSFSGGHVMAMAGSTMQVSGVEFFRMGQHENLARYPIHWHLVGDTQGQYIENSAIHDTYSRCVTVHGTNNVRVENNVAYNNVGHCYFLEDGVEHGNQYLHNLGMLTKCNPTRPCNSTNALNGSGARSKCHRPVDSFRQHGVHLLDHEPRQYLPRECVRRF